MLTYFLLTGKVFNYLHMTEIKNIENTPKKKVYLLGECCL